MGTTIFKADRDTDFYVYWSGYVEEPIGWGTRAEILDMLFDDDHSASLVERLDRMARADKRGTSSRLGIGSWDDDTIMFRQDGLLPRGSLRALCDAYEANDLKPPKRKAVKHLLLPFEDADLDDQDEDYRQEH